MLHVTLGWHLDGAAHPAARGNVSASSGSVALGPKGFLSLLERMLGLGGLQPPPGQRVARYLFRMKELANDNTFYAASFEADPWATAELLLGWRDDLVAGGWDAAAPDAPPRFADLARIERDWPTALPPSVGERIRTVSEILAGWLKPEIAEVMMIEAETLWPAIWRNVFAKLRADGIRFSEADCFPMAEHGDLAAFQTHLSTGARSAAIRDSSLVVLACDNETVAAEAVADWLSADSNDGVVVVRGRGGRRSWTPS